MTGRVLPGLVTKAVAAVEAAAATEEHPHGAFEVVLSAPTEDRDGETIAPHAFDPLPDHITFDVDHGMDVASTVGSGRPWYDDQGQLRVSGGFASTPLAQTTRALVTEGHVKTTSVAFLRGEATKAAGGGRLLTKGELLNGAFVAVPSNREALVLSAKTLGARDAVRKDGRRNSSDDLEHLQTAHDEIVAAGASCSSGDGSAGTTDDGAKSVRRRAGRKSIVGSVEATQDRVRDALADQYSGGDYGWVSLRGVLPDGAGGGSVVFGGYGLTGLDSDAVYRQTYTDDGAVVTLVGAAVEVDIHEVVAPDADADRETSLRGLDTDLAARAQRFRALAGAHSA